MSAAELIRSDRSCAEASAGRSGEEAAGASSGRVVVVPARFSPSSLARYRACPKQFLLQDVERQPIPEARSPALAQGSALHAALERFFGLDPAERSLETLERALRSVWRRHCPAGLFTSVAEERRYGEQALAMLATFSERFDTTVVPLAREQWLQTRLAGATVFGRADRIDAAFAARVDPTAGGPGSAGQAEGLSAAISIVDYKTGRCRLDEDDLRHEPAVQIYVVAAEAAYGLPVENVRLLYLAEGTELRYSPEREDVEALGQRLAGTLQDLLERLGQLGRVEASEIFPALPGDRCGFCAFNLRCWERQQVRLDELVVPADLAF